MGFSGETYENACSPAMQGAFLSAYRAGKKVYDQQQVLDGLEIDLTGVNDQLDKLSGDDEKKAQLKKKRKRLKKDHGEALFLLLLYQAEALHAGYPLP